MKDKVIEDKPRLRIREGLCHGCGLCTQVCPHQAILLDSGKARIEQDKCNQCRLCINVCPQGAIVKFTPVLRIEMQNNIGELKDKANDIIVRIDRLMKLRKTKL